MPTLTDLPVEVLRLIFREFLSKRLTDHTYLCTYLHEPGFRRTRATLYSLSMVSRDISKVSIPLLYEQLSYPGDLPRFLSSSSRPIATFEYMSSVRYMTVSNDLVPEAQVPFFRTAVRLCLTHCSQVRHLKFDFKGHSDEASRFLLGLAELPSMKRLQSLRVYLEASNNKHTIYRDVSHFRQVEGLSIYVKAGAVSSRHPEQKLLNLKHLEVAYSVPNDTFAFMALASSNSLRQLDMWQTEISEEVPNIESECFGSQMWTDLNSIYLDSDSTLIYEILNRNSARLPALRTFRICLESWAQPRQLFECLPPSLTFLHILGIEAHHLLDVLAFVKDSRWLSGSLERITLGIKIGDDIEWDPPTFTKERVLAAAAETMQAARAHKVALKPPDLVEEIEAQIALRADST